AAGVGVVLGLARSGVRLAGDPLPLHLILDLLQQVRPFVVLAYVAEHMGRLAGAHDVADIVVRLAAPRTFFRAAGRLLADALGAVGVHVYRHHGFFVLAQTAARVVE
ncbi:unnamed protein product, partial [Ectocarpus sp. 12 AP-2014]